MLKKSVVLFGCLVSLSAFASSSFPQPGDRGYGCTLGYIPDNQLCLSASDTKQVVLQWSARCYNKSDSPSEVAKKITCDGKYHVLHTSPVLTKDDQGKGITGTGDAGIAVKFSVGNTLFSNAELLELMVKVNNCTLVIDPVLKEGKWSLPDYYNRKAFDCAGESYNFDTIAK